MHRTPKRNSLSTPMHLAGIALALLSTFGAAPARAGEVYANVGLPGIGLGYAHPIDSQLRAAGLGPSARRRAAEGGHPRGACGQSPDLWHAPGAGGAAGAGLRGRARPG